MVDFHVIADDSGLAHHRAGAVVDEKVGADFGPVQVDAGSAVRPLAHDARISVTSCLYNSCAMRWTAMVSMNG